MTVKSYPDLSHDLILRFIGKISQDKSAQENPLATPDQLCPKCNGEGYIIVRVYPWDGCSYDERPCDICNPINDDFEFDY